MCALALSALLLWAQDAPLIEVLSRELDRNYKGLRDKGDPAPYYLAYEVLEQDACAVAASLGALQGTNCRQGRVLDATIRVGSPKLDNYRRLQGDRPTFSSAVPLPVEDGAAAESQRIWLETDRIYRMAAERLIKIGTSTQVRVSSQEDVPGFTQESPSTYSEPVKKLTFPTREWENRVRKWSAAFGNRPEILTSQVAVSARRETRYLVTTEGTRLVHGRGFARIAISAGTKASDGMNLAVGETFDAEEASGLPEDKAISAAVDRLAGQLEGLRKAPAAEPYVGPAILSGRAAGVFFHEIFGHRVEGQRQTDESEGQTFAKRLGTKVLPEFVSVVFDPTRRKAEGVDLNGYYLYDDEGVQARRVNLVESGVLRTFLLSRSPVASSDKSNGHGRRSPGYEVVARQSNLIVESASKVSESRLREMLRE